MKRLLLLLWLVSFDANAGVYKCQSADGKIKYQENPCLVDADARPLEMTAFFAIALKANCNPGG